MKLRKVKVKWKLLCVEMSNSIFIWRICRNLNPFSLNDAQSNNMTTRDLLVVQQIFTCWPIQLQIVIRPGLKPGCVDGPETFSILYLKQDPLAFDNDKFKTNACSKR